MIDNNTVRRQKLSNFFVIIFLLAFTLFTLWIFAGIKSVCLTEITLDQMLSNSLRVQAEETDCDAFGSSYSVRVRLSSKNSGRSEMIFQYDPAREEIKLHVVLEKDGSLLFKIDDVSSVQYQKKSFGNIKIRYDIGHISYPRNL